MHRRSFLVLGATCLQADAPKSRRFTVRCEALAEPGSQLWIPIPRSDPYQTIERLKVESDTPHRIADSPDGNRILSTKGHAAVISFAVVRREHRAVRGAPSNEDLRRYLLPDRLVPIDDQIRGWARETVGNAKTALEQARAIYNHVVATVKYDKTGTGWGRGDIYYACEARRGNCTDFHAIFIGYCRALGIPARFAIGLPLPPERREGVIDGYHCWAEFHSRESGWMPIDASEAAKNPSRREYFFGALDQHRVELSRGRDIVLTPKQAGEPLNYFVHPYAEQGGKAVPVSTTVRFRDL